LHSVSQCLTAVLAPGKPGCLPDLGRIRASQIGGSLGGRPRVGLRSAGPVHGQSAARGDRALLRVEQVFRLQEEALRFLRDARQDPLRSRSRSPRAIRLNSVKTSDRKTSARCIFRISHASFAPRTQLRDEDIGPEASSAKRGTGSVRCDPEQKVQTARTHSAQAGQGGGEGSFYLCFFFAWCYSAGHKSPDAISRGLVESGRLLKRQNPRRD
jgi:hypothetical protein